MTDYQSRFDSHVAEANSAAANHTVQLKEALPGMHPAHIRRLLSNISKLLGQVDRTEIKHPEFLAATPQIIPEKAIELAQGVRPSFDAGAQNFVQNHLPALVDIERKLILAAGVGAYKIPDIKQAQVRALDQILDRSDQKYRKIIASEKDLDEKRSTFDKDLTQISEKREEAESDHAQIRKLHQQALKLSKGHAGQNPLEKLVRLARDKSEEINEAAKRIGSTESNIAKLHKAAENHETAAKSSLAQLESSNERALDILNNATQAGLAGAYKTERDKISRQQNYFAIAFYGIILSIIIYAAIFILPIVHGALAGNNGNPIPTAESAIIVAVRILILAPAVWALIFTNRRYTYLETLQMDYAAKASTALAYSGYRDEMEQDPALSKRLKDGLVVRFLEHPSRLLGDKVERNKSSVGPEGASYSAVSESREVLEEDTAAQREEGSSS